MTRTICRSRANRIGIQGDVYTVTHVENELRALYRSAGRMVRSNEVNVLLEWLVEDVVNNTGLERAIVLWLNKSTCSLESRVDYGFQENKGPVYNAVTFDQAGDLLRKVYMDREPLLVRDLDKMGSGREDTGCLMFKDVEAGDFPNNRRPPINLCIPESCFDPESADKYLPFKQHSPIQLNINDEVIKKVLGEVPDFLIIPLYDEKHFYGYVVTDQIRSRKEIRYNDIRLANAVVNHAAYAVGRALQQKGMIRKIGEQLEDIARLESFYESIIGNLRSGLITVDNYKKINEVNQAAEVILGYERNELLGHSMDEIFLDEEDGLCPFAEDVDRIESSMGLLGERQMVKKSGESFPSEVCFSVITDRMDDIIGLSCIFRDISQRKALEQHMSRMDKLASLGELSAGLAHEIKNPLAGIAGALQVLSGYYKQNSTHSYIFREVQEQVKRLDNLVNSLLLFARPQKVNMGRVDLHEILERSLFLAERQIKDNRIHIERDKAAESHVIEGDESQLQQVFLNIILNSIDAMPEGGSLSIGMRSVDQSDPVTIKALPSLKTNKNRNGSEVWVSFADTGVGIEPGLLDKIFNPFHTSKSKGTGLGLSISQRIMEEHGGTIDAESTPGEGSVFTIRFFQAAQPA